MEVTSLEKFKEAKMMSDASHVLHGSSMTASEWYAFLSDLGNPKYNWVWDEDKKDDNS